jgi:hypothetical protein
MRKIKAKFANETTAHVLVETETGARAVVVVKQIKDPVAFAFELWAALNRTTAAP